MSTFNKCAFAAAVLAGTAAVSHGALVINEFDYDNVSTDTAEYVELFNPDSTSQDLTGYSLVFFNGANANDAAYAVLPLTGSVAPGGYYVVGNIANVDLDPATNTDLIQNGTDDAIGLYSSGTFVVNTTSTLVANSTPTTANLVDGVVYEGQGSFDPAFELAGLTSLDGDSNAITASFQRIPNGSGAFVLSPVLTPGAVNTVPEPASLAALGLSTLLLRRRRA